MNAFVHPYLVFYVVFISRIIFFLLITCIQIFILRAVCTHHGGRLYTHDICIVFGNQIFLTSYLFNFLIYLFIIHLTLHLYLYVDHIIALIVLYVLYFSYFCIVFYICMYVCMYVWMYVCIHTDVCRAQRLRGRASDSRYENPGSNPGCGESWQVFSLYIAPVHSAELNEYLAIDSGGYVYEQPSRINCSIWLDASQRSRDGV